jgi:hypothetical protein
MVALLLNCIIVEQQAVICFLWSESIKTFEIHWRMLEKYAEQDAQRFAL